jgi:hypothetical protein
LSLEKLHCAVADARSQQEYDSSLIRKSVEDLNTRSQYKFEVFEEKLRKCESEVTKTVTQEKLDAHFDQSSKKLKEVSIYFIFFFSSASFSNLLLSFFCPFTIEQQ